MCKYTDCTHMQYIIETIRIVVIVDFAFHGSVCSSLAGLKLVSGYNKQHKNRILHYYRIYL